MLALLLAVLLAPAPAAAAPFNELPFQPVSGGAGCLRPTGAPGELVRWYDGGAEVLAVQAGRLVAQERVALGRRIPCPEVASDVSGAAVLAAASGGRVRVALREPGGTFGAPETLPSRDAILPVVAISARGDAVVAWAEGIEGGLPNGRLRVARRAAGGTFGTPETLARRVTTSIFDGLRAGIDAAGEAVVMYTGEGGRGGETVRVAIGKPGVPFGASERLGQGSTEEPTLAVAADGRALVTVSGYDGLELYERPPGGEFGERMVVFEGSADNTAIALRSGGAAAIAWQNTVGEDVFAVVREGAVPFGSPIPVLNPDPDFRGTGPVVSVVSDTGPPPEAGDELRVALGADGRALLVWATHDRALGTATVTAAGRTEIHALGSPLRGPLGPSPLLLADGTRALAWTDNRSILSSGPRAGRLHLALEGAPAPPAPPSPRIAVGAPRRRALRPAQPLRLPVRCSAACDLRAWRPGQPRNFITASLARAGTAELRFDPLFAAIAPRRPGPVRITVQSGAPGASSAQRRTVRVQLRRLPAPPLPRIVNLRVRRRGNDLVVRWRTNVPVRDAYQYVYATRTARVERDPTARFGVPGPRGRSFRVVLRDAAGKRYVHVTVTRIASRGTRTERIRGPFTAA
jgi:hypothetical protein